MAPAPLTDPAPFALRLRGITKRFGPLLANDAVSLDLRRGEVLALLGENGAGKTTLVNILFGVYVADAGTVEAAGADGVLRPLPPGQPRAALDAGVGMVHQHFALAEGLTVLENVVLGTRPLAAPGLRLGAARARLERLMRESGLHVPPGASSCTWPLGETQPASRRARALVRERSPRHCLDRSRNARPPSDEQIPIESSSHCR